MWSRQFHGRPVLASRDLCVEDTSFGEYLGRLRLVFFVLSSIDFYSPGLWHRCGCVQYARACKKTYVCAADHFMQMCSLVKTMS